MKWTAADLARIGRDVNGNLIGSTTPAPSKPGKTNYVHEVALAVEEKYGLNDMSEDTFVVFIPGHVPSSKNSKQAFVEARTEEDYVDGKFVQKQKFIPRITDNEQTKRYRQESKQHWIENQPGFLQAIAGKPKPYRLEFHFVRKTRHKWDFGNICQILLDMMQEYAWVDNDDTTTVLPYPPESAPFFSYDKLNPGVYIRVL